MESQSRSRLASQADEGPRRSIWKQPKLYKQNSVTSEKTSPTASSWKHDAAVKDKEVNVEDTPSSTSTSSAGSDRKPPQAGTTDWTLDRLYPLDDEELAAPDVTQRRYQG